MFPGSTSKYSFILLVANPHLLEKQNQRIKRKKVAHCLCQINQQSAWGKPGQMGGTDLLKCIGGAFSKPTWSPLDHITPSELGSFPLQTLFTECLGGWGGGRGGVLLLYL